MSSELTRGNNPNSGTAGKANKLRRWGDPAVKNKHEDAGFPHFSSRTGHCMCDDTCCMRDAGCRCKQCPCHTENRAHGVQPNRG